jgi:hypothetical protein
MSVIRKSRNKPRSKNKRQSTAKTVNRKNCITILTLLILFFGGIPGFLKLREIYMSRPIFTFRLVDLAYAEGVPVRGGIPCALPSAMLLLVGTASNDGGRPLTPERFDLELGVRGKWISFNRNLIEKDDVYQSPDQNVEMNDPWDKDLQKFAGTLKPGESTRGLLRFLSDKINLDELTSALATRGTAKLRLTCVNASGKRYAHVMSPIPSADYIRRGDSIVYPHHGIKVSPKKAGPTGTNIGGTLGVCPSNH